MLGQPAPIQQQLPRAPQAFPQARALNDWSIDPRRSAAQSSLPLMGPRTRRAHRLGTETKKAFALPDPIEAGLRRETARCTLAAVHKPCSSAICSLATRMEDHPIYLRAPTYACGTGL